MNRRREGLSRPCRRPITVSAASFFSSGDREPGARISSSSLALWQLTHLHSSVPVVAPRLDANMAPGRVGRDHRMTRTLAPQRCRSFRWRWLSPLGQAATGALFPPLTSRRDGRSLRACAAGTAKTRDVAVSFASLCEGGGVLEERLLSAAPAFCNAASTPSRWWGRSGRRLFRWCFVSSSFCHGWVPSIRTACVRACARASSVHPHPHGPRARRNARAHAASARESTRNVAGASCPLVAAQLQL